MHETYGRYQLLKKLATGGMAQIYLARQAGVEGFEKLVVVKRILPHLAENEDFITMFLDEARIAARLNHPNVVQIFDLGNQDDSFYIAMEYIHGEDVRKVWKQAERLGIPIPLPLICRIIIDACNGLDYAHKKVDQGGRPLNIVHRDISPQNILVSFEGHVKIVDFGIAKAADQATVTKSGVLKGKYSYMSPEQAAGQPIDCRTDTFALGVVLYELLTGARLFKRTNDLQTLNAVMVCAVDPPSTVSERCPPDLDAIVMKALAKDRNQRYPEARALGADLEAWLLAHQLPSSTSQLAVFMQEIYAERLAQEAEEGRLQFIESEGSRANEPERATPDPRSTKSQRSVAPARPTQSLRAPARPPPEPTSAERPARTGSQARPRTVERPPLAEHPPVATGTMSARTESAASGPGRGLLWSLVGALVVVGLGATATWVFRPGAGPARVEFNTMPSGATLTVDGAAVADCQTPCTLPPLPAGRHNVAASRDGYKTLNVYVEVAEHGERALSYSLELDSAARTDAGASPAAALLVATTFTSEPSGAVVVIGGEHRGLTPLVVPLEPDSSVQVKVELEGYLTVQESVVVGTEPGAPHAYVLKLARHTDVARRPTPDKPVLPADPTRPAEPRGSGVVRFVVNPWATVECPPYKFGDTPFPKQTMAAGEYTCTFVNAELGKRTTQKVKVEPGSEQKVAVNLAQP